MHTRTDIIVPQWNKADYTVALLDSIIDANTRDYRIILIENGSETLEKEKALDALERHPHLVIENAVNKGFIQGVNQGLQASDAEYVCIQNNDTLVEPDWLEKMLEVFVLEDNVGMVGPTTVWANSWQAHHRLHRVWGRKEKWPQYKEIHSMLAFFCTVIPRTVIEKVGLLDEDYGLGFGDDDDYAMRVKMQGYRMFVRADVTIPHHHRTTFKSQVPGWKDMQRENIIKFKRNWRIRPRSTKRSAVKEKKASR